jgi:D-alanine-D-alanine ligase-like ATP-grasp enzyme
MDNTNMNTQFKDYPASEIKAKLQQCLDYEAKYGSNATVTAVKTGVKAMSIVKTSGNGDKT